jgi:polar amino acid transport system substrate-binding protein
MSRTTARPMFGLCLRPTVALALLLTCALAMTEAQSPAKTLAPTGTLRAVFLGTNPVHGRINPNTLTAEGPVPDLVRALARQLHVNFSIMPAADAAAVIASVNGRHADIGFLAYDKTRALEVDFVAPFIVMYNSYVVRADSPIQHTDEVDRGGVIVAAVKGQTQELFVSSNLKSATVRVFPMMPPPSEVERLLTSGDVDAFAVNRQRALDAQAASNGKLRALPESFLEVDQAFVVAKGDRAKLPFIESFVAEARASGLIKSAIDRAGLTGVDVAVPKALPKK